MFTNKIFKLLDKLEVTMLKGIPIPLTPWVIVNNEAILNGLDNIRKTITDEAINNPDK